MSTENKEIIFKIRNLQTWFPITKGFMKKVVGHVKAVDDVSLDVYKGETLGIVGESGCGKSTFGKTVMMLEKPTGGQVMFNYDGEYKDITQFNKEEMFEFRKKVQMVFQDPYSALNPQKKIYSSFEEPLKTHGINSQEEREKMMQRVLKMVNIQPDYLLRYPHEFSGGQRQRLCIARALEVMPEVLICDEPVSALDVSIQAQVLNLMKEIQQELSFHCPRPFGCSVYVRSHHGHVSWKDCGGCRFQSPLRRTVSSVYKSIAFSNSCSGYT